MIGLKRGIVKLIPHKTSWSRSFEYEKKRILSKVGDIIIDIQHIGSTSISGIKAKPIIDMSAGITKFKDATKLIKPLHVLGYRFYRKFGQQILFAKGPNKKRTHYLHAMKFGGAKWRSDLLFRDYLRTHHSRAREYEDLKLKLAKEHPQNRDKYTAGKKEFIEETIELAKKYRKF